MENEKGNGCGWIVLAFFVVLLLAGSCGGGSTRNLHREALDKMDRGERLDPAERKRIDEILNYKERR